MAFGNSGIPVSNFIDILDASALPVNLVGDSIKAALFTNTLTPDFSGATPAYAVAPYNANEVTGTGYTAGGVALASKTLTESPAGSMLWDSADPAWTSATFSGARGAIVWDDTITTPTADPVLEAMTFGADFGVTGGTFTIQLPSAGWFTIDLTP